MRHAALLAGIVFFTCLVQAQTFGVNTGEVTDATGAVASNLTVTATNSGTNASRATKTNGVEQYSFPDLVPATFQVKVTAEGLQTAVSTLELQVQQTARVDFVLTVFLSPTACRSIASALPKLWHPATSRRSGLRNRN